MSDILVLGLGNMMRGDDAIGLRVADLLSQMVLPPGVEVWPSPGNERTAVDIIEAFVGRAKVMVLDAVQGGGRPGEIYRFSVGPDETLFHPVSSLHGLDLLDVLALAQQLGMAPSELIVVGVEPLSLEWGTEITTAVAAAMPLVIQRVLDEIQPRVD